MSLSLTQKWLKQVLAPYPNKDHIYADIDSTLVAHSTLKPKNDVYTFNDGRAQLLICVHGLIPITFRQATYNIPVAIWIPLEYPRLPPLVYVVPTSDMLVKSGKHVDPSGECAFEYLDNWRRKSEASLSLWGCNLRGLIETMQEHFSRDPPVYAKPKAPVTPAVARPTSAESSLAHRPPPPLPSSVSAQPSPVQPGPNRVVTPSQSSGGAAGTSGPPALPPKVYSTQQYAASPAISPIERTSSPGRPPLPASPYTNQPPARPPFPYSQPNPRPPPPIPSPQNFQQAHNRSNSLAARVTSPSHLSASPTNAASPQASNRWSMPPQPVAPQPQQPPAPPTPYQYHPAPPPPPPLAAPAPTPIINAPTPPAPPPASRPNFLDEDEAPTQAVEAPPSPNAPPRPMNPELLHLHYNIHQKITTELTALSNALAGDTDRLRATQADLLAGEPAIRDEMARLEAVRSVCVAVGDRLNDAVMRAEANVHSLKSKGDPEVDELVCSTAIVYNQLIDLIAEDKAIEDTMYHLHRALNSGRIDLDRFIRTVRILAQEQFMKRALIEKINEGLPIGARFHNPGIANIRIFRTTITMAAPIAQVFIGNVVNTPTLGRLDILEEQVILVDVNGVIADVCPLSAPSPAALHHLNNMPQTSITRLPPTSFFTPTFVDLHLHAPQFMYLGTGLHLPLLIWLDEYAYKAEERLDSDPELAKKACSGVHFVYLRLAQRLAENGTGAVLAFGTIKEDTNIILAEAFATVGLRIFVGKLSMDQSSRPSYRETSTSASLVSARSFIRRCRGLVSTLPAHLRLVEPVLTPRFVPTCSDAVLRGLSLISRGENVKIQSHLAEAHDQVDYVRQSRGKSDMDIFNDAGLLSPRAIFAHCTFLEIPELNRLREAGSAVAHCPLSNAYFSTLPFRLREALDMGLKVGLGTDVAGGYQVDIMNAMRQAVITSRMRNGFQTELVPGDAPLSIDWKESLYMATRGGAIALGLKSGIIHPGAPFDVQRIDFFNSAGEGLGDMDFFDVPMMLTEPIVEKWWCLGNSANRLNMWVQGRKIF